MPTGESFISKYLSSEQQLSLIGDLITEKKFDEVVEIVSFTNIDLSKEEAITEKLFQSFTDHVKFVIGRSNVEKDTKVGTTDIFDEPQIEDHITLINRIPSLRCKCYDWLNTVLSQYISENHYRLFNDSQYYEIVQKLLRDNPESAIDNYTVTEEHEIVILLYLLEKIYLSDTGDVKEVNTSMDGTLIALLNANIEDIAVASSKLMRWKYLDIFKHCQKDASFDASVCEVLNYIYFHFGADDWKERNALCLQLRFLTEEEVTCNMLSFMRTDGYWTELQRALNHTIHENRKLGLSILKLSVQKLMNMVEPVHTTHFDWIPQKSQDYLDSWKRFTTLYEIVSLDTSLNQIQAAYQDILALFDDKYIDPTWNMILFSTGLTAPMESVRKYMLTLVFRVKNPAILTCDLNILRENILKSVMQASFYNVHEDNCPYGTTVVKFVNDLIEKSSENRDGTLRCILQVLIDEGASFDPARIYVALGVLHFFQQSEGRDLKVEHLHQIRKLFEFECEDEMLEAVLQKIYLDLLQYIHPDVGVKLWLEAIKTHIICMKFNLSYVARSYSALKEFANSTFVVDEKFLKSLDNLESLVYMFFNIVPNNVTVEFLRIICSSELVSIEPFEDKITNLIIDSITKPDESSPDVLAIIGNIKENQLILQKAQKFVNFDIVSTNFSIVNLRTLCLIAKSILDVNTENTFINLQKLPEIYGLITKHYNKNRSTKSFISKDETFGLFFDLIYSLLKNTTSLNSDVMDIILPLMLSSVNDDNGHYIGNLAVSKLVSLFLNFVFDNKLESELQQVLESLFKIISIIWENITSERLILKEKALQIELIRSMFHAAFLKYAITKDDEFSNELRTTICVYAQEIATASASRRGLLPILTEQLSNFSKYKEMFLASDINYTWVISIFVSIIKQSYSEHNLFKLKPIITTIFDEELTTNPQDGGLYEEYYGKPEITSQIHLIDAIYHFDDSFRKQFISFILLDTSVLDAIKRNDGAEEKERLKFWQYLLLSLSLLKGTAVDDKSCNLIFNCIDDEASPLVRLYKEWTIAFIFAFHLKRGIATKDEEYLLNLAMNSPKPATVVSTEKILYLVLSALLEDDQYDIQPLLRKFLGTLLPNSSSNKPLVRHFSNSLILSFWPTFNPVISEGTLRTIIENLFEKAKETEVVGQFRPGDANVWHLYKDVTLTSIFGGIIRRMTDHEMPLITKEEFIKYIPDRDPSVVVGEDDCDTWLAKRDDKGKVSTVNKFESDINGSSPLQTKSGAWETVLDLDNKKSNESVHRSDLIVVSSLVDKPPNLGGICRLCDVLGVGLLTVQDIRVKNHPQFKNVAVTADKWMPIEEVPVDGIIEFMKSKKRDGYTLIGLEQTDRSIKLDDHYRFPKKSLILLGTEAHGIPGHLLSELDLCLEIQQFGVIRSMNIQTATAVIVHSYTIQHM